jgi:hypothetical protein
MRPTSLDQEELRTVCHGHEQLGDQQSEEESKMERMEERAIITKLMGDRIQSVILSLVHLNQYEFIKIRTIQDCLA